MHEYFFTRWHAKFYQSRTIFSRSWRAPVLFDAPLGSYAHSLLNEGKFARISCVSIYYVFVSISYTLFLLKVRAIVVTVPCFFFSYTITYVIEYCSWGHTIMAFVHVASWIFYLFPFFLVKETTRARFCVSWVPVKYLKCTRISYSYFFKFRIVWSNRNEKSFSSFWIRKNRTLI